MTLDTPRRPLIVIVGPTAVGKTETAIQVAERLAALTQRPVEIVSADSRYLYRGMDIGTAKPTPEQRARVAHHLVDVTTPDAPWSLARFQVAAFAAIDLIHQRDGLPLLVGGTGQYVRAIVEGWHVPAGEADAGLRAELEAMLAREGAQALAERLRRVDPESAQQVDLRNPRRVIRALEVALRTGQSFVSQRGKWPPPYSITTLGLALPRPELYARIDARIDWMIREGLVAEVKRLVAQGYSWDLPAMSALGYRQIGQYLRGEFTLEEAIQRIRRDTRQFVRRQANWFKLEDPRIRWFTASPSVADDIVQYLAEHGLPGGATG